MALKRISDYTAATLDGTELLEVETAGGLPKNCTAQDIADLGATSDQATIVTEASTSTMTPATHSGRSKYVRAADDVTFNTSESYTAGDVFNIRATAALSLIGTGVTLTEPYGGTLDLEAAMAVTVVMTSSSAGDVIGQTVPV